MSSGELSVTSTMSMGGVSGVSVTVMSTVSGASPPASPPTTEAPVLQAVSVSDSTKQVKIRWAIEGSVS